MWRVRVLLLRLVNTFRRGRADEQLSREIDAHLAILEEEFRRRVESDRTQVLPTAVVSCIE